MPKKSGCGGSSTKESPIKIPTHTPCSTSGCQRLPTPHRLNTNSVRIIEPNRHERLPVPATPVVLLYSYRKDAGGVAHTFFLQRSGSGLGKYPFYLGMTEYGTLNKQKSRLDVYEALKYMLHKATATNSSCPRAPPPTSPLPPARTQNANFRRGVLCTSIHTTAVYL